MISRTITAACESVRMDSKQPLLDECARLETELERLRNAICKHEEDICQTAGKALGYYPWFKDDQKNFPGADESWGVCVGDHVSESITDELAKRYAELREFVGDLLEIEHNDTDAAHWRNESVRIPSGMTLYVGGNKPKI